MGGEVFAGGGGGHIHHVTLIVLVVTQRQQDNVALVDPDLLAKLATNVAESAGTVEALRLQAAVSRYLSAHMSPAASCRAGPVRRSREAWLICSGLMCQGMAIVDIPEHLHDLCVLLAFLLEGEFSLLIVVFVLSTSAVLASFSLVLGHLVGLLKVLSTRVGWPALVSCASREWVDNKWLSRLW